jgi:hypothetical protein
MAILRLRWAGTGAVAGEVAGLERNRFLTREAYLEVARPLLETRPDIGTLEQLAHALDISSRTQARYFARFGIDKDELADWSARRARARSITSTTTPCRWTFGLVVTASTLEEAVARFRAEISPSVEIESVQKR